MMRDLLLVLLSGASGALLLALLVLLWPAPAPRRDGFEVRRGDR